MKKTLILMAAAASVVLTGCTESDLSSDTSLAKESAPSAIEFSAKTGNTATTRAVVAPDYEKGTIGNSDNGPKGLTDLKKARFGVFAYYTGAGDYDPSDVGNSPSNKEPNFMYNQELIFGSATTNEWVYSPVKYWPNGIDADNRTEPSYTALQKEAGKLSFFAFAPYTAATAAYTADETYPASIAKADLQKTANTTTGVTAITDNEWTGNVWVKYLMPNAAQSEAVDLLWGLAGTTYYDEADGQDPAYKVGEDYNTNLTKQVVNDKVSFLFKHALVKIGGAVSGSESLDGTPDVSCGFKVQVDVDENNKDNQAAYFGSSFDNSKTLVTIKSVKIQDGATAWGDRSNNGIATDATEITSNLVNSGWFNIETGTWSSEANTYTTGATYSLEANSANTDVTDNIYTLNKKFKEVDTYGNSASSSDKKMASGDESWDSSEPTGVTTTAEPLFCNENVPGLMIIPISGVSSDLYVTVDYVVRTADKNLKVGYTQVEQVITNKVSLSTLLPNKYYTIIMHLGLTSVKFEAKVVDWTSKASEAWDENGNDESTGEDNESKVWLPSNVVSANTWSITADPTSFKAKGEATTLTVTMNGVSRAYDATADDTHYSLAKVGIADWLTIGADGKLTAGAYTTSTAKRTAIVNVTTIVNGNTITTPITLEQAGFSLAGTVAGAGNTVVVKDGDDQAVPSGYTVTVSGGDGAATHSESTNTITLANGNVGQTYNVTVTHTASGATITVPVPYTAAP